MIVMFSIILILAYLIPSQIKQAQIYKIYRKLANQKVCMQETFLIDVHARGNHNLIMQSILLPFFPFSHRY
jgi:hypothetical protein